MPHLQDENSVCDDESIGRGLKRKPLTPAPLAQPSPAKQTKIAKKDPLVTVGHVLRQGKKSFVMPQDVSQSTPKIFQKEGFVTIEKATKKPKGKGFLREIMEKKLSLCTNLLDPREILNVPKNWMIW